MSAGKRALLRSVLGEVLRRIRLEQGRTLAEVALAARISLPYLSEVERGRKEVSSEVLAALCAALGIDLADLLGGVVFRLTSDSAMTPATSATPVPVGRAAPSALRQPSTLHPPTAVGQPSILRPPAALRPSPVLRPSPAVRPSPARRAGDAYALAA